MKLRTIYPDSSKKKKKEKEKRTHINKIIN